MMAANDEFQEGNYSESDLQGLIHNEWGSPAENDSLTDTLDEPVLDTLMRDINCILEKFKYVFLLTSKSANFQTASRSLLKDWDLWGPLMVCCLLGLCLHDESSTNLFTLVFVLIFCGSLAVTLNTKLLGGTVSMLQSMCVLGYCLGPLTLSLPFVKFLNFIITSSSINFFIKLISVTASLVWSCYAAMKFMLASVSEDRKALAVYPVCLFYTFIAWMILTQ